MMLFPYTFVFLVFLLLLAVKYGGVFSLRGQGWIILASLAAFLPYALLSSFIYPPSVTSWNMLLRSLDVFWRDYLIPLAFILIAVLLPIDSRRRIISGKAIYLVFPSMSALAAFRFVDSWQQADLVVYFIVPLVLALTALVLTFFIDKAINHPGHAWLFLVIALFYMLFAAVFENAVLFRELGVIIVSGLLVFSLPILIMSSLLDSIQVPSTIPELYVRFKKREN